MLDINVRFIAKANGDVYIIVDGQIVDLGYVSEWKLHKIQRLNAAAEKRFRDAQTGPQPGPGGPYPEGSQQA